MIYICVPVHDEGQTVGVVLWKVRQVMAEIGRDYQILVADDGSTDKTAAVLDPYTRVLPLTVMRTEQARGYGASVEMLLREAVHRSEYPRRDALVVLQADFTEDPEHILSLLKRIESGADVVVSNVAGGSRAPLKARLTGFVERLLARRQGVPEEARDALEGFHAYRVSVVRRAFEKDTRERLLPWHGRVANAALLAAVVPHARRVDVVEWTPRPERRQRAARSDAGARLREVWAFSRNRRPADVIPVAGLAPSSVRTARTSEHEVSAEALRTAGVTRPGDEEQPRRRRSGGSRNGKARPGVKDGRRTRKTAAEATATPKGGSEPGEATTRRRRRKPPTERAQREAGEADPTPEVPGSEGEATEPKRRRSRRGRRRTGQAAEVASIQEEPTGEPEPAAEADGPDEGGDVTVEGERRPRRRRGRRGGRRRTGRSRNDEPAQDGPGDPEPPVPDGS